MPCRSTQHLYYRGMSFVAEASILLDVSPEVAFDRLADYASWQSWMPRSFRPARGARGTLRAGEVVRVRLGGMPFATPIKVRVVERAREIAWGGGSRSVIAAHHRFLFEAEGTGTRVRSVETWDGPLGGALRVVLKPLAERIGREQLGALERAVRK